MEIIYLIAGLAVGGVSAFLFARSKFGSGSTFLSQQLQKSESELSVEREKVIKLNSELSARNSDYRNLQERLAEQKAEVEELQEKFAKEFENLANKILTEKSETFTKQNRENLDQILKPLGEKIKDFEKKVEEVYVNDSKDRSGLSEQLRTLFELNQKMTKEAANLTNALKGETKTQGNWGEFVLENLLENSGLVKDREYFVQESVKTEDGRRLQPDIIVKLPEKRSIIIDSKVTLVAYEKFNSSEDKEDKEKALKEHILSIKSHYKDLSSKNYHNLYGIDSLDFVFMFLPIEPAWSLAFQSDNGLFQEAFEKKIAIVSPTMLLINLKMIASIWRRENQNKNAMEIARLSGTLHDKFVNFVNDLKIIGDRIKQSQDSYDDAMKKLKTGRGNLISSSDKIRKLGAKASKSLPESLIDNDTEEDGENLLEN